MSDVLNEYQAPDGRWYPEDQGPGMEQPKALLHEIPTRAAVLHDAERAVCKDRNAEYGEPIDNFGRWAGACNSLGYRGPGGRDLKPHDLAVIMGLGKLSRSVESPEKADTWIDLAGYAAVGYELVTLEDR